MKVEAGVYDKEAEQSSTKDNEGEAVRMDLKGVAREEITTFNVREHTSVKIGGTKRNS